MFPVSVTLSNPPPPNTPYPNLTIHALPISHFSPAWHNINNKPLFIIKSLGQTLSNWSLQPNSPEGHAIKTFQKQGYDSIANQIWIYIFDTRLWPQRRRGQTLRRYTGLSAIGRAPGLPGLVVIISSENWQHSSTAARPRPHRGQH